MTVGRQVQVGEQLLLGTEPVIFLRYGLLDVDQVLAANTSSAVPTTRAPAATYSSSGKPEPDPAPTHRDLAAVISQLGDAIGLHRNRPARVWFFGAITDTAIPVLPRSAPPQLAPPAPHYGAPCGAAITGAASVAWGAVAFGKTSLVRLEMCAASDTAATALRGARVPPA